MEKIKDQTQEIEYYISTHKNILTGAKISFILLLLVSFGTEYLQTIGFRVKYKYTWFEWNTIQLLLLLAICTPFILMPLHKFISDRLMNRYVWGIKNAIFESVLSKYNADFQISINGSLPDKDIKFLQLEKGWVSFVYGDDLIVGTINDIKFRMSEMHSNGIIFRHFDGVIAVIVFDHLLDHKLVESTQKQLPEFIEMKHFENRLFLLAKGNKKLFELKIKKDKANTDGLIEDQKFLKELMATINELSIRL